MDRDGQTRRRQPVVEAPRHFRHGLPDHRRRSGPSQTAHSQLKSLIARQLRPGRGAAAWYHPRRMPADSLVIVLAGGVGERLFPLTKERAKPAVYFGGPYRIIDFTLSNCVNSGFRRIFIATQYKSLSLSRHIRLGWRVFSEELGDFIEILPPQKRVGEHWYLGTADAVYQNLYSITREAPAHVIVLSGDHVYKMDYSKMLRYHVDKNADATLATIEVPASEGQRFGIVGVDASERVIEFQ